MTLGYDETEGLGEPFSMVRLANLLGSEMTLRDTAEIRACFPAGLRSFRDAEALFSIEQSVPAKDQSWSELFVELVVDFVVWGERPTGVLTNDGAAWLLAQFDQKPTLAGVATLIAVLDDAHDVPSWFKSAVHERALNFHKPAGTISTPLAA